MDEKDKLIKEQRAEIAKLHDELDELRPIADLWSNWHESGYDSPEESEAYLVIWRVPSWDSISRQLYWEILTWDGDRKEWEPSEVQKKLQAMNTEYEILYWLDLPDARKVEELML